MGTVFERRALRSISSFFTRRRALTSADSSASTGLEGRGSSPYGQIGEHCFGGFLELQQQLADEQIRLQHLVDLHDQCSCGTSRLVGIPFSRGSSVELLHLLTEPTNAANFCLDFGLQTREVHGYSLSVKRQLLVIVPH